jgi:hypothetical protein
MPTQLHALLIGCLLWVLYPLWLAAGAVDYLCHRRTRLEQTSGATESIFHIAQFLLLLVFMALATLLRISAGVLAAMAAAVAMHSAITLADVAYTYPRRRIPAIEQWVHGFMDVLPPVAWMLLALLNWDAITRAGSWRDWDRSATSTTSAALFLGSYAVLAGVPIFEEFLRCLHAQRSRNSTATELRPARRL